MLRMFIDMSGEARANKHLRVPNLGLGPNHASRDTDLLCEEP
jgi:hypothetical protein